ncbi:MAG: EAL and HDOD domain-containing protein [Methylosarcina sp.]
MLKEGMKKEMDCPIEIVQVGRQPILDCNQQTYGYELLYRYKNSGPDEVIVDNPVTPRTLLYTFLEFGVKHLVGPHRAFINFSRALFTDILLPPLENDRFVFELNKDIQIDSDLVNGIRKLHKNGYSIAVDDYRFESRWDSLLPYCSILKIDIAELNIESIEDKLLGLKGKGLLLLAENVETHAEFEAALRLGFDLFQGYFFAKPQVLSTRILQSQQNLLLKMISRINDPTVDLEELARLISLDPKLSFKVLRFINSAFIGFTKKISSIRQAVMYIGLKKLRGWASFFIMSDMEVKNSELMVTGLVRADMCHSVSKEIAVGEPERAYTVGLLSILDALLDRPIEQLVKGMQLPIEMTEALIEHCGPYSIGLNCVLALEQGQSLESFTNLISMDKLNSLYIQAIAGANDTLNEFGKLYIKQSCEG